MASILHTLLGVVWLAPDKDWHMHWNNASYNRVYAFNASPIAQSPSTVNEAEVTRVWRTHSQSPELAEAEVHVIVKNTGSFAGPVYVFMSGIGP
jgi:hypothetical protein